MKKFFTLIAAATMMFAANAETLDLCMGGSLAGALPIYGLWVDAENTTGQMIYPADMLEDMVGNEITGVRFYTSVNAYEAFGLEPENGDYDYVRFYNATIQLSLKVVDELGFTVEEAMVGATPVATAQPEFGDRYMTFVLDEPFAYEGGNLLVECKVIEAGTYGSCYWWVEAVDGYTPGYYEYESYSGLVGYTVSYLPAVTFTYQEGQITPPEPPVVDQVGAPTFEGYTEDGIYGYGVYIHPTTEGSNIMYRVFIEEDGEWVLVTDWTEYLGVPMEIWMDQVDAKYRIEAYAYIGQVTSNTVAYEYQVEPMTSISEMNAGKTVAGVRYFNVAGQEMTEANGLTIVVTTYTDGTTSTAKVVK